MQTWEASYIAGIIDGEGSISLTRMLEKEHRRLVFQLRQQISNSLDMFKN